MRIHTSGQAMAVGHSATSAAAANETLGRAPSYQVRRAALLALVVLLGACSKKSAEQCEQAMTTTRQAVEAQNMELVQQWRDFAYKRCEDKSALAALDQQIVAKQAEVTQRKADEERKKTETAQLLGVFAQFIGEKRTDVATAAANVQCVPPEPVAGQPRWCSATRSAGERYTISVRYLDGDKEVFRFVTRPENPTTCTEIGEHNVVRTWQVPATDGRTAKRTHCEFTKGSLAGLHALVSEAANADVHVFSPKYLEHDPAMRQMVQGG
jgi:hypothetical protein